MANVPKPNWIKRVLAHLASLVEFVDQVLKVIMQLFVLMAHAALLFLAMGLLLQMILASHQWPVTIHSGAR